MTLLELAERCERATGPDRELDCLIRCALFAREGAFVRKSPINGEWCIYEPGYGGKERLWEPRGLSQERRLESFTASLDAAMSLVPELDGVGWRMTDGAGGPTAEIWHFDLDSGKMRFDVGAMPAATPALALCAAALRARATLPEGEER